MLVKKKLRIFTERKFSLLKEINKHIWSQLNQITYIEIAKKLF